MERDFQRMCGVMRRCFVASLMCLIVTLSHAQRQSVGLVLSGGGAKGIAHIGVIRALEQNNIPIDYITGTSMGAIIGSLYACGYTPDEMEALLKSKSFAYWSSGRMSPHDIYYCEVPEQLPAIVSANINIDGSSTGILPSSLINPLPMNFAFMDLFAAHTAQCNADFNRLFVPFRSVCSDVYHKHKIVCRRGSLGDAVRASMSFPIVFTPIEMDGVLVYDGGIYDNFPVDVMIEEFHPDIVLGVDVSAPDKKPDHADIMQQVEDMIMQKSDYEVPPSAGIRIHVPVQQFALLDWAKTDTIEAIGYATAMSMMDSIRSRVTARVAPEVVGQRRGRFNATRPEIRFCDVTVKGLSQSQNQAVERLFSRDEKSDTFSLDEARSAYYRAVTPGRLKNLVPTARWNDSTGLFSLDLKATPMNRLRLGFGGYVSSSANSMVFFSAGLHTLGHYSSTLRLDAWLGQSYAAMSLYGRLSLPTSIPTYLSARGVVISHKMFDDIPAFYDNETTLMQTSEYYGRLSFGAGVSRDSKLEVSMGGALLSNRSFSALSIDRNRRDRLALKVGQARAVYQSSTLDSNIGSTEGHLTRLSAFAVFGSGEFYPQDRDNLCQSLGHKSWAELHADYTCYWPLSSHFSMGVTTSAVLTNAPTMATYGTTMSIMPTFQPTPASFCQFNPRMTARQYAAIGFTPVARFGGFQIRAEAHLFVAGQEAIVTPQGVDFSRQWGRHAAVLTQLNLSYNLQFAQLAAYGGYNSGPGRNWNIGISFGLYFLPPSFLK